MEQVLDKLEMNMQKIETLTEEEKELPKEMFIALSGEPELVDVSKLFQAMKKLGDVMPVRAPNSQCEFARLRKIAKRSEFAFLVKIETGY